MDEQAQFRPPWRSTSHVTLGPGAGTTDARPFVYVDVCVLGCADELRAADGCWMDACICSLRFAVITTALHW